MQIQRIIRRNIKLSIIDAIESMQGEDPTANTPYNSKKILISKNSLSMDVRASKMIGMDIDCIFVLGGYK